MIGIIVPMVYHLPYVYPVPHPVEVDSKACLICDITHVLMGIYFFLQSNYNKERTGEMIQWGKVDIVYLSNM